MNRLLLLVAGAGLSASLGGVRTAGAAPQDAAPPLDAPRASAPDRPNPDLKPADTPGDAGAASIPAREAPEQLAAASPDNRPVRPLNEGPLHEAFLSPAKDREPTHVAKAPPAPIVERPGVDPPDPRAQWV